MKCPKCDFMRINDSGICPRCGMNIKAIHGIPFEQTFPPSDITDQCEDKDTVPFTPPNYSRTIDSFKQELDEIESAPSEGVSEDVIKTASYLQSEVKILKKGGFWIRFLAFTIDTVVIYFISLLLLIVCALAMGMNYSPYEGGYLEKFGRVVTFPYLLTLILLTITYFTYFIGTSGQTIGKLICYLKVVQTSGEPLTYGLAFLRWVGYLVSSIFFCFGFFWIAIDPNRQGWHDKIADTYVVRV